MSGPAAGFTSFNTALHYASLLKGQPANSPLTD